MTDRIIQAPESLEEAQALATKHAGDSLFLSGTTWLRTQWESGYLKHERLWIRLDRIAELNRGIRSSQGHLYVSAMTTFAELQAQSSPARQFPLLMQAIRQIAAPSIREQATLGGNVATGIGDSLPALIVLDTEVIYHDHGELQQLLLTDWLKASRPGILVDIVIPFRETSGRLNVYEKAGRRAAFIPSAVTIALYGQFHKNSERFSDISVSAGGGTMKPVRLHQVEQLLTEESLTDFSMYQKLQEVIHNNYRPPDDPFMTMGYKQRVASNTIIQNIHSFIEGDGYAAE